MSLAIIPRSSAGLPPARAQLVDLNRRIADAEHQLATLCSGRYRLRSELGRANSAKIELDVLISDDASSLVGKLRSGVTWALSNFGSPRAQTLVAQLSESRVQHEVGAQALQSIDAECKALESDLDALRARKPNVVAQAAAGLFEDYADAVDQLRDLMVQLRGLEVAMGVERIPARTAAMLPDFTWADGLPEMAVVAPAASIATANNVWQKFARTLGDNPLASADEMKFPSVDPYADDGLVEYGRMTATERRRVDILKSHGV
jgi:hypothetical protein